ncbi:MAG: PaaI family thioesterase [Christensenellaceae bacterium]|nr:PaaI family thioesterase [Christensenellaceae bacterium]
MKRKVLQKFNNSKLCIVCGMSNDLGLKARFYELEGGELLGVCHTREEHQSYPGRMHGGMSAALLDETMGRAMNIKDPDGFGVTLSLQTVYRKPVPLDATIYCLGRITKDTRRIFEASGEILLEDGTVLVEATGRYLKMPIEQISDESVEDMEYRLYEGGDLEEIDL